MEMAGKELAKKHKGESTVAIQFPKIMWPVY